jgi:hypothetical protein
MPDLIFHSNGRREAAEKQAVRFQYPPSALQHGGKVIIIAREVEYGATNDHIGEMVREGHSFQRLRPEVVWRQRWGETARGLHGPWVRVDAEDLVSRGKKVVKISTETAARIEDLHAGHDAAAQDLIEQVDIDLAELLSKGRQSAISGRCGKRRRLS